MSIRKLTITAALVLAASAATADLVTLVEAVELTPSNIILPGSVNGTVTFKPCAGECEKDYRRARLTPATEFFVDDRKVKFEVFGDAVVALRGDDTAYALLSVDLTQNTITSIRVAD